MVGVVYQRIERGFLFMDVLGLSMPWVFARLAPGWCLLPGLALMAGAAFLRALGIFDAMALVHAWILALARGRQDWLQARKESRRLQALAPHGDKLGLDTPRCSGNCPDGEYSDVAGLKDVNKWACSWEKFSSFSNNFWQYGGAA